MTDEELCVDWIVVGAGPSAMGLLHGLLGDTTRTTKVAIVERGRATPGTPLESWYVEAHRHTLQGRLGWRSIPVPLGRGLGGASTVNAGLCLQPSYDYLPGLRKAAMYIEQQMRAHDCLMDHAEGIPLTRSRSGERRTYYDGLVRPIEQHQVEWFTDSTVDRLLQRESGRVSGIALSDGRRLWSRREVILCAGAVGTPSLLYASGLLGGDSVPLRDHVLIPTLRWGAQEWRRSPNGVHMLQYLTEDILVAVLEPTPTVVAGSVATIVPGLPWLIQGIVQMLLATPVMWILRRCFTVVGVFMMNPHSEGELRFDGDEIQVNLPYFRDERDLAMAQQSVIASRAFFDRLLGGFELFPGRWMPAFLLQRYIRATCQPFFHYMSTCRMGPNKDCPVDEDFGLRGVKGLRLCDASILTGVKEPPALTCASVGFLLAERLAAETSEW